MPRDAAQIAKPPRTPKRPVTDVLHGTPVTDDYRWLETRSDETRAWVESQNESTDARLGTRPEVGFMREALAAVLGPGVRFMDPSAAPGVIFVKRRDASANQAVLVAYADIAAAPEVVYDPAQEAYQPTALDSYAPSPSGRLVVLGTSVDGSEDTTLRTIDRETGREVSARIPHAGWAHAVWRRDESGFYYTRHPAPGTVPPGEEMYHQHVYYHALGQDPSHDPDLFGAGRPPRDGHALVLSEDERWLYLFTGDGWRRNEVWRLPVDARQSEAEPLLTGFDASFHGVERGGRLILETHLGAPRGRIIEVDPNHPDPSSWRDLVPPSDDVIRGFRLVEDTLLVHILHDVSSQLFLVNLVTGARTALTLPTHGSVSSLAKGPNQDLLFLFESFAEAPSLYRVSPADGTITPLLHSTTAHLASNLVIRQDFYEASDGTRCPIYLVHRKNLGAGPHPTVLTGYGGFNIALQSHYAPEILPWIAAGGVFAQANMRGGGEYGEGWHRAGMEDKRQDSFDDFADAARWLVGEGITDRDHLGVSGRSLGGLLTGVLLTQHPDLVRAVVSGVPLLDMLRYHLFLIGALWIVEYGSPDVAEHFAWIHAYSPYHHVEDGRAYPAVYLTAGWNDGRVDPLHAWKMAARLQAATAEVDEAGPVFLRTHFNAGHGAGKPLDALVQDQAETWGFLAWQLGLPLGH